MDNLTNNVPSGGPSDLSCDIFGWISEINISPVFVIIIFFVIILAVSSYNEKPKK